MSDDCGVSEDLGQIREEAVRLSRFSIAGWYRLQRFSKRVIGIVDLLTMTMRAEHEAVRMRGVMSNSLNEDREQFEREKGKLRTTIADRDAEILRANETIKRLEYDLSAARTAKELAAKTHESECVNHRETRRKLAYAEEAVKIHEKARQQFIDTAKKHMEEQTALSFALAERVYGQHEILQGNAEKKTNEAVATHIGMKPGVPGNNKHY